MVLKALVACLLMLGCASGPPASHPSYYLINYAPTTPAAFYEREYHNAEECLERLGDYDAVIWGLADIIIHNDSSNIAGLFVMPNRIVLKRTYQHSPLVVRHESIHHILQMPGHPGFAFPGCVQWNP